MTLVLTRDQVRRVDELAVTKLGIQGLVLMENAGRNAAAIIDARYGPRGAAVIVCGTGNNGGDGYVIARHLSNAGWTVRLASTGAEGAMTPDTAVNFRIARAMGITPAILTTAAGVQLFLRTVDRNQIVVDALLGTGFHGQVRSPVSELIDGLNAAEKRATAAIDVPSGLDCDSGEPSNATIRADLTITFVASKVGFARPAARAFVGEVIVADIGAPRQLIEDIATGRA